jgi:DNA-binding FadR family transcriptional regulator
LGQLITSGELGDDPLVLDDLCHIFDASRTAVRESFRALEAKGLISARPNVGTHARPASDWNQLDPDVIEWRSRGPHAHDQHRELHELRWTIETAAIRLAARQRDQRDQTGHRDQTDQVAEGGPTGVDRIDRTSQADEDMRTRLCNAALRMDQALLDQRPSAFARADAEFHHLVVQACGNRVLEHLHRIVSDCTATGCRADTSSLAHHEAVAQSLLDGDGDAAEEATRNLLAPLLYGNEGHSHPPGPRADPKPPGPAPA